MSRRLVQLWQTCTRPAPEHLPPHCRRKAATFARGVFFSTRSHGPDRRRCVAPRLRHHVPALLPLRESLSAPSPRLLRARPPGARRGGGAVLAVRRARAGDARPAAQRAGVRRWRSLRDVRRGVGPQPRGPGAGRRAERRISPRCRTSATSRTRRAPLGPRDAIPPRRGRRPGSSAIRRSLGISFANYTSRDFTLASADTLDLRGVPGSRQRHALLTRRPQRPPLRRERIASTTPGSSAARST